MDIYNTPEYQTEIGLIKQKALLVVNFLEWYRTEHPTEFFALIEICRSMLRVMYDVYARGETPVISITELVKALMFHDRTVQFYLGEAPYTDLFGTVTTDVINLVPNLTQWLYSNRSNIFHVPQGKFFELGIYINEVLESFSYLKEPQNYN